jgi:hypothetical protein
VRLSGNAEVRQMATLAATVQMSTAGMASSPTKVAWTASRTKAATMPTHASQRPNTPVRKIAYETAMIVAVMP